jgi:hypothetical protein
MFIHLACTFRDESQLPSVPGSIERSNDVAVGAFRHRTPQQTLDDYRALSELALERLTNQQIGDAGRQVVDLDDAGRYPAHLMADSLVFDHYCHLKHDLSVPGSLTFEIAADAATMAATLTWLIAGLPMMSPPRLADALTAPVALKLTGAGGGSWILANIQGAVVVTVGTGDAAASLTCTADEFLRWGTHRVSFLDADVRLDGDTRLAHTAAAAIKVF